MPSKARKGPGGRLFRRFGDEADALDELKRSHNHARAHVAPGLDDALEPELGVSEVRLIFAHVDVEAGGARDRPDDAPRDRVLFAQRADARHSRLRGRCLS